MIYIIYIFCNLNLKRFLFLPSLDVEVCKNLEYQLLINNNKTKFIYEL